MLPSKKRDCQCHARLRRWGKRIRKSVSGRTKTEAKTKLRQALRDAEDGLTLRNERLTVADAVEDFLRFGLASTSVATRNNYETIARLQVVPHVGGYQLKDLRASQVEVWLDEIRKELSTRTIRLAHGLLSRAVKRAMARDQVKRNVVELVDVPDGLEGRKSKSLTVTQAEAILRTAEGSPLYAYIVVALLTRARTEELRALTWHHTHLAPDFSVEPPTPPHLNVFRSVRRKGDTMTRRSRRSLALPKRCIIVLERHRIEQAQIKAVRGDQWEEHDLVFASAVGTQLDASNVRRAFRQSVPGTPGVDAVEWTPRELRHSFVSLLSDQGVPIEEISRLVGHSSTSVTETIYRHQLRPVIERGAETMDGIFGV